MSTLSNLVLDRGTAFCIQGDGEELYVCTERVEFRYDMSEAAYVRTSGDYEFVDSFADLDSAGREWDKSFDTHIQMVILSRWRVSINHKDITTIKEQ